LPRFDVVFLSGSGGRIKAVRVDSQLVGRQSLHSNQQTCWRLFCACKDERFDILVTISIRHRII
jgi:hypothetical protein